MCGYSGASTSGVEKKGKNVERAGFSVGIVEHCVRECRGMESIGLLHLTLSSLSVKWHHRQLQGLLYNIGSGTFLKQELNNLRSAQTPEGNHAYIYWTWFTSPRCTGVMRRYEWKLWVIVIMISVLGGRLYSQTWDLSKKLHDRVFRPKILHTKSACIATIFTHNKTV